ncbi:MAG: ACP phosphodiesterase [Crocinitomicaceae bacterium]
MNFLGHLYFSNNDLDIMYANLQGDYIKGKDLSHLPEIVQKGSLLHRTIDNYIDTHPAVKELLHQLYPHLPKISGIAIDLYFDHLLARDWSRFHNMPMRMFIDQFYNHQPHFSNSFSPEFQFMLDKMKEMDWLFQYQYMRGLSSASSGLSRRISFENNLHQAPLVFNMLQTEIESAFEIYMESAQPFFEDYFKKN